MFSKSSRFQVAVGASIGGPRGVTFDSGYIFNDAASIGVTDKWLKGAIASGHIKEVRNAAAEEGHDATTVSNAPLPGTEISVIKTQSSDDPKNLSQISSAPLEIISAEQAVAEEASAEALRAMTLDELNAKLIEKGLKAQKVKEFAVAQLLKK